MTDTWSPDTPVERVQRVLQHLSSVARDVCDEIWSSRPDLVICMMHTGRLPYYAATEPWNQTQSLPFPPMAPVNLGLEKKQHIVHWRPTREVTCICELAKLRSDMGD